MNSRILSKENSASIALHALRAVAAQIVCVGHAINLSGLGYTYLPQFGVMVFFLISGFVIADTLMEKSRDESYDLPTYAIQRVARIYTAYLPALVIIALVDHVSVAAGLYDGNTSLKTWVANVLMLQQFPMENGFGNFGSTGHLTSVATEFHIYLFVGAVWFLMRWRNPILCVLVALLFYKIPFHYFQGIPNSDKALFVLWLFGFASYFLIRSASITAKGSLICGAASVLMISYWLYKRVPGAEYDINNYPVVAIAFVTLVLFAKSMPNLPLVRVETFTKFCANYSFSLFLIHLTIVKIIVVLSPLSLATTFIASVLCANILAMLFAHVFERHYHSVSRWMVGRYKTVRGDRSSVASGDIR